MLSTLLVTALLAAGEGTPAVGTKAPDFHTSSTAGTLSLSSLRGKWIVLYFYPKSFTPGCTHQACSLRDGFKELASLNAVVIGVSTDDLETQKKFKQEHSLPFELIADSDKQLVKAYGVSGILGFAKRRTFIIDPEGTIRAVIEDVNTSKHAEQVRTVLEQLQAKK